MSPGTTPCSPTGLGEGKEEQPRAQGQLSELPFPRVPLVMLPGNREEHKPSPSLHSHPGVPEQAPHLESRGMGQGQTLHSGVAQFPVVSGPHLPAVTVDNCLCPSVPQFP